MLKATLLLVFVASLVLTVSSDGCGGDPNAGPGCGVNCGRTCTSYKQKSVACPAICIVGGCDCKKGFVFDDVVKKCVLPADCTPICGSNEIVSTCSNGGCGPFKCSDLGKPILCVDPVNCTKGCVCQNTYLRADNGTCVPKDQCTGACGGDPNAKPGCGVNCGRTCSTYKAKHPICPTICKVNGCDCKDNFVFDPNVQKCVPPQDCTPTCRLNEVYSSCTNGGCDARNCSQVGKPVPCVKIDPNYCIKGCVCDTGYLRASNGTCIPKDQCPPKCANPNEVFDVCLALCPPRLCDVDDSLIRCAAPPKPGDPNCKPGCRCADNYARNAKGICVPRSQCDKPENKCRKNEVFDLCPPTCPPQKCGVNPALVLCANPGPEVRCQPGCKCIDGYVRNDTDVCIPRDQCPQCSGQNEFYDTCIAGCGSQNCSDIGKIYHCPIQPAVCRTGCRCKPGFFRNADNVCVPESKCPAPPCPEGETYNRCPTVKCEGDNCPRTRESPLTCPVGIVCDPPRCVCGFNSHRDRKTGRCIATADCPPFACNGPNEEYQACPATCPGEKCSDYINNSKCPPFRIGIVVPCKPQCKCKKGYYRNDDGICIIGYKCELKNIDTTTTTARPTPPAYSGQGSGSVNISSLQRGIADFTGKFLYDRMQASKGENIIISAFSVFTPLAQLALYAIGESLKQLLAVLHVGNKDDIRNNFPALVTAYEDQGRGNISQAALLCFNKLTPASESFIKDAIDIFHAEIRNINFADAAQAAADINSWVASKTDNQITDLVSRDMFSAATRIALVNAILYQGTWLYQFDEKNTHDQDFFLEDGTNKTTKLMYQEAKFKYGEFPKLRCKMVEMMNENQNISMVAVLPDRIDGVTDLAEALQDFSLFYKAYNTLTIQKVKVWFPKFEIRTTTDLSVILKQKNVVNIFNPANSGLEGVLENPKEKVFISTAVQKAGIIVNEKGAKAFAANVFVGARATAVRSDESTSEFNANHGFLYSIFVKGTTTDPTPVYSGIYRNPE